MNMKQRREAFAKKLAVLLVILHPKSQKQSHLEDMLFGNLIR